MAEKKYEKCFLVEPFGHVMHGPGIKVPPGTPLDKPYWIGIGRRNPKPGAFLCPWSCARFGNLATQIADWHRTRIASAKFCISSAAIR